MKRVNQLFESNNTLVGIIKLHEVGNSVMYNAKKEISLLYLYGVSAIIIEPADDINVTEDVLKYLQERYSHKIYGVNISSFMDEVLDVATKYEAKLFYISLTCENFKSRKTRIFAERLKALREKDDVFVIGRVDSAKNIKKTLKLGKESCDAIAISKECIGADNITAEKLSTLRSVIGDFPIFADDSIFTYPVDNEQRIFDGFIIDRQFRYDGNPDKPIEECCVDKITLAFCNNKSSVPTDCFEYKTVGDVYHYFQRMPTFHHITTLFGDNERDFESCPTIYLSGAVITEYHGEEANVIIPAFIDGLRVIGIAEGVFLENNKIESVYFEDGITRIGEGAFEDCKNLRKVRLPSTLIKIDEGAFGGCPIETIDLPASLYKIGAYAFWESGITRIELPAGLYTLGQGAFEACRNLKFVKFPTKIREFVDDEYKYEDASNQLWKGFRDESVNSILFTFFNCHCLENVECDFEAYFDEKKVWHLSEVRIRQIFASTPWYESRMADKQSACMEKSNEPTRNNDDMTIKEAMTHDTAQATSDDASLTFKCIGKKIINRTNKFFKGLK